MRRAMAVFVGGALATGVHAGVTTATKTLGGPGDFSSCGVSNPPTLCDGITQASATFVFTYDDVTKVLTLTVTNTSPVVTGVPNPLLSQIYLNVPFSAATSLNLLSQATEGGVDPGFSLDFDPDLNDGQNSVTAPGFCAFNGKLDHLNEVAGGIANAAADTISSPADSYVFGPVTFVFQVGGPPAAGVKGSTYARSFSHIPPGPFQVNVAAKFKQGGLANVGGTMSNKPGTEPGNWMTGAPCLGCQVQFVLSGKPGTVGCLAISTDPGPTVIPTPAGNVTFPIGMPAIPVITAAIPGASSVSATVTIPPIPALVGLTFHSASALLDPATLELGAGEGFTVTVGP